MTELRELIYPEDRTRYDELVYRRERDPYSVERHRVSSHFSTTNSLAFRNITFTTYLT